MKEKIIDGIRYVHGAKFQCKINNFFIEDGRIFISHCGEVYLCQNSQNGSTPHDRFSYKYGWHLDNNVRDMVVFGEDISEKDKLPCPKCSVLIAKYSIVKTLKGEMCSKCKSREFANVENAIRDSSHKPSPVFFGREDMAQKNLFFGFELEVQNYGNYDLREVASTLLSPYLFCKYDGSISNGFEIVSHPASFEYIKGNTDTFNFLEMLDSIGFKSYHTDSCGMHVHISKDAFTTPHLYAFMKFFHCNKDFIYFISQRKRKNLDQWAGLHDHADTVLQKFAKDKSGNSSRYSAINLHPSATVEIRIFSGNLNRRAFLKNIEFLHALYCYTGIVNVNEISVPSFLEYVGRWQEAYGNLYAWLKEKMATNKHEIINTLTI